MYIRVINILCFPSISVYIDVYIYIYIINVTRRITTKCTKFPLMHSL